MACDTISSIGFKDSHQTIFKEGVDEKNSSIENRLHEQRTLITNNFFFFLLTGNFVLLTPSKFYVMRLVFDWFEIEKWIDELMWQYKSVLCKRFHRCCFNLLRLSCQSYCWWSFGHNVTLFIRNYFQFSWDDAIILEKKRWKYVKF